MDNPRQGKRELAACPAVTRRGDKATASACKNVFAHTLHYCYLINGTTMVHITLLISTYELAIVLKHN